MNLVQVFNCLRMKMWSLSFFARNLKWSVLTSHGLAISRKDGIALMKGKKPKKEKNVMKRKCTGTSCGLNHNVWQHMSSW